MNTKRWKPGLLTIAILMGSVGRGGHGNAVLVGAKDPGERFLKSCAQGVLGVASSAGEESELDLGYRVDVSRPATHLVEVQIVARKAPVSILNFVMPAWSPGRYAIYNFAKNVQEFKAVGAEGQPLPWHKTDKQTWQVDSRNSGGVVRVSYRVYSNDLSGTFSQVDTSHANLNGASIFMYIAGHEREPLTLAIDAPANWKVIGGYSESSQERTFRVPSYDVLVDTPLEISSECAVEQFQERGKTFRVAVHAYGERDASAARRSELTEELKKMVRSEMAMMPAPSLTHYTFIFHFDPDGPKGDGMEHLNSTQIVIQGSLSGSLNEAVETAAHEFFHLWNVKRLRPAGLVSYDYTRENYTPSLWFAEGLTTYYSYLHLLRSGLWNRERFLNRLATEIRSLELEPGRKLVSAEDSSFNAWFYDRAPQMQQTNFVNATISYYNKGALLGLLLDLEIRARTSGRKSLDDVMRSLVQEFYQSPAAGGDQGPDSASTTGPLDPSPRRGYAEQDILDAVNTSAGTDFSAFFKRYVQGTEPLPYSEVLAHAGLVLRIQAPPDAVPSLGVSTEPHERGLRLTIVRPDGGGDRAGLSRGDILIATDDIPLAKDSLKDRLRFFAPGSKVSLTVERHGKQEKTAATLGPALATNYTIEESPGATPAQLNIRNAWLGK